jgi:hypothetical protein
VEELEAAARCHAHPIIPIGDKIERVRKHQGIIRSGGIQLPADAVWRENFVAEWTLFPCAGFDHQVDAAVQYLEWISRNPAPCKRELPAVAAMANSRGQQIQGTGCIPDAQGRGGVLTLGSRRRWY